MDSLKKSLATTLLLAAVALFAAVGVGEPQINQVTTSPPVIDGILDECWFDRARPLDMRNFDGTTNNMIIENYLTMIRILWNREFLYVSFVCSDDKPKTTYARHDDPIYREDICEVMLQVPGNRYLYEISISPTGILYDARLFWNAMNRFEVDKSWQCENLRSAVKKTPDGDGRCVWTVELAIPWTSLGIQPPTPGTALYGNFLRYKRIHNRKLLTENQNKPFLSLSLFPTGIRGWPAGPSSQQKLYFR